MTCTPLTDRQFLLLAALTGGPRPALDFDWDEVEVLTGKAGEHPRS